MSRADLSRESLTKQAPSVVLQAAISKFLPIGETAEAADTDDFKAAATFKGAMPGYYFGRGAKGQGYAITGSV